MKKGYGLIFGLVTIIVILILSIAVFALIQWIQGELFAPKNYIMWVVKPPFSMFVFIYEIYLFIGYLYLFRKDFREMYLSYYKKIRKIFLPAFIIFNFVLLYAILVNVTVLFKDKVMDYSFFNPQGKEYPYSDIVKINTGVYGEKSFAHSKGDFYYFVVFKDGKKVDLANEMGAAKNDVDPRFILEKLDKKLVDMKISKNSSMANFKFATKNLGKIYTDKIKIILKRKNR